MEYIILLSVIFGIVDCYRFRLISVLNTQVVFVGKHPLIAQTQSVAQVDGKCELQSSRGAYHIFGITPDDLRSPLCNSKRMGHTLQSGVHTSETAIEISRDCKDCAYALHYKPYSMMRRVIIILL